MEIYTSGRYITYGMSEGKIYFWDLEAEKESISADNQNISEKQKVENAFSEYKEKLSEMIKKNKFFEVHEEIAEDEMFIDEINNCLEQGDTAVVAVKNAAEVMCQMLLETEDEYLMERVDDIRDVANRICSIITGEYIEHNIPKGAIVVAKKLFPSDTATMELSEINGFIIEEGGETSHVAIIAGNYGIPTVLGCSKFFEDVKQMPHISGDTKVIIDCNEKKMILDPDNKVSAVFQEKKTKIDLMNKEMAREKLNPAKTKDGKLFGVYGNAGSAQEVKAAIENGADGIGLLRTEFLYLDKMDKLPDESEQFEIYKSAVMAAQGKPIIVRTLDIGGDKKLPTVKMADEENPFLGCRGIRFCLAHQDIFVTQLRALLKASVYGDLRIMYPMIGSAEEIDAANQLLNKCKLELAEEGIEFNKNISIGIMIETPASVFCADILAKKVDFFSIGTNDLTQYILAADRGNSEVSEYYNSFHYALLRAIKYIVASAHENGIYVGMCGEMAGHKEFLKFLTGIGIDEFSVSRSKIPEVKYGIRNISSEEANIFAENILQQDSFEEIKAQML